jgi:hypothetical protein
MDKAKLIQSLIDNDATAWTTDDKEQLEGMDEATLNKLVPVVVENKEEKTKKDNKEKVENAAKKCRRRCGP